MDEVNGLDDLREVFRQVVHGIEEVTGLKSRWNGTVETVPDAPFLGRKHPTCSVQMDAAIVRSSIRWRTMIHEALHSVSAGCNPVAFQQFRGWEEGVVEQLQRLVRPALLPALDVAWNEAECQAVERDHPFNTYIAALESIRLEMGQEPEEYYLDLIRTPLRERYGLLLHRAMQAPDVFRVELLATLSKARVLLDRRVR